MRSVFFSLVIAVATSTPAHAQQPQTTHPHAAHAAAKPGVSTGEDALRPTVSMGVEFAEILPGGNVVTTVGLPNATHGIGNIVELRWNTGVIGLTTSGPVVSLTPEGGAKMLLLGSPRMTVAAGGNLGLNLANNRAFDLHADLFIPVSLWRVGPGNVHVIPGVNVVTISPVGPILEMLRLVVAYELPLGAKWTLLVSDTLTGAAGNTLQVGGRVRIGENLTADVGSLVIQTPNLANSQATGLTIQLFNLTGHFGGRWSGFMERLGLPAK